MKQHMSNPEFIVFVGCMFSGKTSKMLLELERLKFQRRRIIVFKPLIDDRYSTNNIVSHGGLSLPAINVKSGADILDTMIKSAHCDKPINVVAVDEAFMVSGVAEALIYVYKLGVTVVVSTLDLSAAGKPFKEIEKMLPWATKIEKCTAICTLCSRDARYTYKKQTSEQEIEVGGAELYEPRCFDHHPIVNQRPKLHEDQEHKQDVATDKGQQQNVTAGHDQNCGD
jgi:thymidine kinase